MIWRDKLYEGRCPVCGRPTWRVASFLSSGTLIRGDHPRLNEDGEPVEDTGARGCWDYPSLHCGRHSLGELREAIGLPVRPDEDPTRRAETDTITDAEQAREALRKAREVRR